MTRPVAPNKVAQRATLIGGEKVTLQDPEGGPGSYFETDIDTIRKYIELKSSDHAAANAALRASADKITTEAEAAHFLRQVSLGPMYKEIQEVVALGSRTKWLWDQINSRAKSTNTGFNEWEITSPTVRKPLPGWIGKMGLVFRCPETGGPDPAQPGLGFTNRILMTAMLRNNPDTPLNVSGVNYADPKATFLMKVTWILNKFICSSFPGGAWDTDNRPLPIASWYGMLARYAFRPYKELLTEVTYHPAMTRMLTSLRNKKSDGVQQPDENYAREVMQLFTIGLYELNIDGSVKVDGEGQPIQTYDNEDILVLSRVFTGFTRWDNTPINRYILPGNDSTMESQGDLIGIERTAFRNGYTYPYGPNYFDGTIAAGVGGRTQIYEYWNDKTAKVALGGRINIPAGLGSAEQIDRALEALVNHPSTAPFVCRRLIQFAVTSNPSPSYIARVAEVFRNNGRGQVGDMASVWVAIFTDPEAAMTNVQHVKHGRIRDGFELFANMVRSFDRHTNPPTVAAGTTDSVWLNEVHQTGNTPWILQSTNGGGTMLGYYGAWPYMAPSIFGYYPPDFTAYPANDWDIVTPELGSLTQAVKMTVFQQLSSTMCTSGHPDTAPTANTLICPDYVAVLGTTAYDTASTAGATALVDRLNLLLCGGQLEPTKRQWIINVISTMPTANATDKNRRVSIALQLIIRTPEFWVM